MNEDRDAKIRLSKMRRLMAVATQACGKRNVEDDVHLYIRLNFVRADGNPKESRNELTMDEFDVVTSHFEAKVKSGEPVRKAESFEAWWVARNLSSVV